MPRCLSTMVLLIGTLLSTLVSVCASAEVGLTPYTARYGVKYRGLSGGDIEFTLKRQGNDRYVFASHLLPNFLGSLFTSDQAEDRSEFVLDNGRIKPQLFRSEDGTQKTDKDQRYEFDWARHAVSGVYKDESFTLTIPDGVQERLSIQLAASLALQANQEPGQLIMLERNELQDYQIKRVGTEKIKTALGELDTIVLSSERTGSPHSTRYWYAPKLGYIPARAERYTKGKPDIVMELKSYQAQ